jgi:CheY-like chemotaxis protein
MGEDQMHQDRSILLVEDDEIDVMSVRRALRDLKVANRLYHVGNGEEALEFLKNTDNERPAIILLDINMPRMNGIEFLKIIKQDPNYWHIPIVILTTSRAEMERHESFSTGAAGYMVKPVEYKQFVEVIRAIDLYWTLSELPD